ncbi:DoxX family protein [Halobacteria archaeon AArc-curdl1]|uniref:DoxX family protein n=1 Tax=Natronosalvus hydrolyticus TaxID=2979988 RepID=A0AAP3E999_9EURY|nr:DoxX family protein [Halobacteria archaeon AArc-curdl1]
MTPPTDTADGDNPPADQLEAARAWLDSADRTIISHMDRLAVPVLRVALGVVFIWFGGLKVIGGSPAADLVAATVYVVPPELFVPILGVWEVLIGICLLYRPLIRLGILLLFLQMPGTFLPIVLLPSVVFETFPYALTVEGQYIVKNLVIIGAALVVGATVRKGDKRVTEDVRPSDSET